jgi:hypothetical protein
MSSLGTFLNIRLHSSHKHFVCVLRKMKMILVLKASFDRLTQVVSLVIVKSSGKNYWFVVLIMLRSHLQNVLFFFSKFFRARAYVLSFNTCKE